MSKSKNAKDTNVSGLAARLCSNGAAGAKGGKKEPVGEKEGKSPKAAGSQSEDKKPAGEPAKKDEKAGKADEDRLLKGSRNQLKHDRSSSSSHCHHR